MRGRRRSMRSRSVDKHTKNAKVRARRPIFNRHEQIILKLVNDDRLEIDFYINAVDLVLITWMIIWGKYNWILDVPTA